MLKCDYIKLQQIYYEIPLFNCMLIERTRIEIL